MRRRLARWLPRERLELLHAIGRIAAGAGQRAYLVGGGVRDLLLDRPTEDLDVVVDGDVAAIARMLADAQQGSARIHERFGTASVRLPGGLRLDLAAARSERYAAPAALPTVAPGNLLQDLGRRDFTIHAIAVRLDPAGFGQVVDPYRGRADLRQRTIRSLHERSFVDDPTRAFRALRYRALLGFTLAPATARDLRAAIRDGGIARLTPARVRNELARGCAGSARVATLRELARHGLLAAIHPALRVRRTSMVRLQRLGDALAASRAQQREEGLPLWAVVLAILMTDEARRVRAEVATRLGADRRARQTLVEAPAAARRICARLALPSARRASFVHRVCQPESAEALVVAAAIAPSAAVRRRVLRFLTELRAARADVRGGDLLRAGVPAGPRVARGLAAALRAKLDGKAPDFAAQLRAALAVTGIA